MPPIVAQNDSTIMSSLDTSNELTSSNIYLRSINLSLYIFAEHDHFDMDSISKLVVRHIQTIDSVEQFFPI
ncbi:unnamed protein product [Rotaria sordida]|uniref:Uncharacterized protein n=1 Tax=Rotaria sordida TaxID=392033 RepID=A0A818QK89_9BILA|nr:unnamed protein product [Rotaria sordida]CAF3637849.1 unnamed protein product [Rotaria sordida]